MDLLRGYGHQLSRVAEHAHDLACIDAVQITLSRLRCARETGGRVVGVDEALGCTEGGGARSQEIDHRCVIVTHQGLLSP